MEVILYNSTADPRRVQKQQYLTSIATVTATPYYPISVETPTFTIKYLNGYIDINYCYVPELHRYYFVNSPLLDSGGLVTLSCEVDPLMSFKSDILNLDAICIRNEYEFNKYILDSDIPSSTRATTTNFIINDATPFIIPESDAINCYVLTLNGLVGEVSHE